MRDGEIWIPFKSKVENSFPIHMHVSVIHMHKKDKKKCNKHELDRNKSVLWQPYMNPKKLFRSIFIDFLSDIVNKCEVLLQLQTILQ